MAGLVVVGGWKGGGKNNGTTWRMRNEARESPDKCAYTSKKITIEGRARAVRAASFAWQLANIMLIYFIRRQFKVYKQQFASGGGKAVEEEVG